MQRVGIRANRTCPPRGRAARPSRGDPHDDARRLARKSSDSAPSDIGSAPSDGFTPARTSRCRESMPCAGPRTPHAREPPICKPSEILLPDDVRERRVGPIEANQCQAKRNRQWLVRLGIANDGETGHRALGPNFDPISGEIGKIALVDLARRHVDFSRLRMPHAVDFLLVAEGDQPATADAAREVVVRAARRCR